MFDPLGPSDRGVKYRRGVLELEGSGQVATRLERVRVGESDRLVVFDSRTHRGLPVDEVCDREEVAEALAVEVEDAPEGVEPG